VGQTYTVTGSARNCGDRPASLTITIKDGQGTIIKQQTFLDVAAQDSRSLESDPITCAAPGTNNYSVEASATNNCGTSDLSTSQCSVTCSDRPTCEITGDNAVCEGETQTYTATPGSGVSYVWSVDPPSAGAIQSGQGTSEVSVTWSAAGTLRLHVCSLTDPTCCGDCSLPVSIQVPDVDVTKSADPAGPVDPGATITYTITVSNPGPVALENLTITDNLCAEANYANSANPAPQSQPNVGDPGGTIVWTLASLDVGANQVFTYQVTAGTPPAECTTSITCHNQVDVVAFCADAQATASATEDVVINCPQGLCCWLTMGGHQNAGFKSGNKDNTFGGNVGPPPSGSWQHIQRQGKNITFNFHSHDAHVVNCFNDGGAGPCHPNAEANIIEFAGTGFYSYPEGGPREFAAHFTARVEDRGEPGNLPDREGGCGTPDYYTITVTDDATGGTVAFTVGEFLTGGNCQIHECKNAKEATDSRGRRSGGLQSNGSGDSPEGASVGASLELYRPSPNPFTNTTVVAYAVNQSQGADVQIGIYNVAGKLVRSLVSGFQATGRHETVWDGRSDDGASVTHGVYFLRAFVGGERIQAASRILYLR
jgi:uncharacterized repeat protein (TIGR01451 family)